MRAAAFLWVWLAALPAAADCEVMGVASLERLRLRVDGEPLRTLAVTGLPVAVRPGHGARYRDIRVQGTLQFAGRTDIAIPWSVPRGAAVSSELVWLTPQVEIEEVREALDEDGPEERALMIRVQVDAGVWLSRLRVPCDALIVGPTAERAAPAVAPDWAPARGPRWLPRADRLWFVTDPEDGEAPSVRLDAPNGLPHPMVELERRGEHVRVAVTFASGAALRGWVQQEALRAPPETPRARSAFVRAAPRPEPPRCARPAPRGTYVGLGRVAPGTAVHATRGGTVWAQIGDDAPVTIAWRPGDAWARVVHVPGLREAGACPEILERAWVPRAAVRLQGERAGAAPGPQ